MNKQLIHKILGVASILVIFIIILLLRDFKTHKSEINHSNGQVTSNINDIFDDDQTDDLTETDDQNNPSDVSDLSNSAQTDTQSPSNNQDSVTNKEGSDITISFTGDILLSDNLYTHYTSSGVNGFLSKKVSERLSSSNICFVDQEFPFSERGNAQKGKEYTYRVPPMRAVIFKQMGVDLVSLANNHVLDYGQAALYDTFNTLDENGIDYVGAGNDLDRAKKLITKEVNGKTIGFLSASRIIPDESWYARNKSSTVDERAGVFGTYDSGDLCDEIKKAKEKCDFVVVYVHWGIEKSFDVADYQRKLAHNYIDSGADLIVGTHPHVLQGVEYYKNIPIVYSLGNFLFSNYQSRTTVLTATIKKDNTCALNFLPCTSAAYYTYDSEGQEVSDFYEFMEQISYDTKFNEDGSISPK